MLEIVFFFRLFLLARGDVVSFQKFIFTSLVFGSVFIASVGADAVAETGKVVGMSAVWEKLCDVAPDKIKLPSGKVYYLFAEKYSMPALAFKYKNGVCYGKLAEGATEGSLNFVHDGIVYHLTDEVL